jgi:hypothetical protein
LNGQKAIGLTFTDKPVTAFGGLALLVAFAQRIGLVVLTSPNATPPHQIVLALFAGVLAGARRFAQLACLRVDEAIRQLFGLRRYPSTATFTRFFRRFTAKTVTIIFEPLFRGCLARLPELLCWSGSYPCLHPFRFPLRSATGIGIFVHVLRVNSSWQPPHPFQRAAGSPRFHPRAVSFWLVGVNACRDPLRRYLR